MKRRCAASSVSSQAPEPGPIRAMEPLRFGEVTVERLVEAEGPSFHPAFLLPDSDGAAIAAERDWLEPHFLDPGSGRLIASVHSFVVRTPHHTILIDTCVGNHKERPSTPPWHRQELPWLAGLGALGVRPEEVDVVLCTHLHVDHVGWNTRLVDRRSRAGTLPLPPLFKLGELLRPTAFKLWASACCASPGRGGRSRRLRPRRHRGFAASARCCAR